MNGYKKKYAAILARPGPVFAVIVALAIAAGVALRLRVLTSGFGSDDYMEFAMLKGVYPVPRSPLDLFNFSDGSAREVAALREFGTIPWWSHPNFRLAMMRPLSSALIVLDYALFGSNLVVFHLHSLLWWAFLVVCAAVLLRELFPLPIAAIAIVLFALDESHTLPVEWLANRGAMVSLSLGILGLWAHIRWRGRGGAGFLVLSLLCFSLAILAGEWTFPVLAYLFAFEALGADGSWGKRARALIPAFCLIAAFLIAQRVFRYSSLNSNVYVNPFSEPWLFIWEALQRFPIYFAELFFGLPAHWAATGSPLRSFVLSLDIFTPAVWRLIPNWHFWHVLIGIVAGATAVVSLRWGLQDQSQQIRRELRWLLAGAVLALIPMVASFSSSRSALPALLGVSVACAIVLMRGVACLGDSLKQRPRRLSRAGLLAVVCILFIHVLNASARSMREVAGRAYFQKSVEQWLDRAAIDDRKSAGQDVILVNGLEHTSLFFGPFVRYFRGHPLPRSWRILNAAPRAQDIERVGPNVLQVSILGGQLLASDLEIFYRAERFPFKPGDAVSLRGLRVEILQVMNNKPRRVRFVFEKNLEDPSYVFLRFGEKGVTRFQPPEIGNTVRLPRARIPDLRLLTRAESRASRSARQKR